MDEDHLLTAVRYVGLNPVRARLTTRAEDWRWSSARAHLTGEADGVTMLDPVRDRLPLAEGLFDVSELDLVAFERLRKAESVGRPLGSGDFLERISHLAGRPVKPAKRGRKRKLSALSP